MDNIELTNEDKAIMRRIVRGSDVGFYMSLAFRRDADVDAAVAEHIEFCRTQHAGQPRIYRATQRMRASMGMTVNECRAAFDQ